MTWIGKKNIAFIPLHRPNAHPPDAPIPTDWPAEILRRVYYDPNAFPNLPDRSLRTYIHTVSSGLADSLTLEGLAARDDEWLERPLVAAPAMNAHFAWFHTAEDEINHRGQIRWLRKRLASALS